MLIFEISLYTCGQNELAANHMCLSDCVPVALPLCAYQRLVPQTLLAVKWQNVHTYIHSTRLLSIKHSPDIAG